jgi:fructuronate reductase/mannitol 2-dehydrogenase
MAARLLRRDRLDGLHGSVARPGYDPARARAGIVHLGLGGFHRAHMARYTHDLMAQTPDALGWGIVGAGLLASDRPLIEALSAQERLYTLVERDQNGEAATVVGSLCGVVDAGEDTRALIETMVAPTTRIVSLTVTEHGYCLDAASKTLDGGHAQIRADLADPERPRSAIGVIVEALRRRRAAGHKAFTALSCDNIQHNGQVLRGAVLALAARRDPALADWIAARARFPCTMVDRITPMTRAEDIDALRQHYGLDDRAPVFAEPFRQWVIEDDFVDSRPDWDLVGAQFVADVAPHETMKLRLLNASHLAIAGLGALMGYRRIDEAIGDARLGRYMRALMDRETGPTLAAVPGVDLDAYKAKLIERFANPNLRDTVERVNTDAPVNYLLDPLRDRVASDQPIPLLGLALAAWLRRMRGVDDRGGALAIRHPQADLLRQRAIEGGSDPRPLLTIPSIFGALGTDPRLVDAVARALDRLCAVGAAETLDLWLAA